MAINTAPIPSAVVRPAISISRLSRAIMAACSGVSSAATCSVMNSSSSHHQGAENTGERRIITAGAAGKSQRLARVLADQFEDLSRTRLKALIVAGHVSIGGAPVQDPAHQVKATELFIVEVFFVVVSVS